MAKNLVPFIDVNHNFRGHANSVFENMFFAKNRQHCCEMLHLSSLLTHNLP
jgi:hypothetical protein